MVAENPLVSAPYPVQVDARLDAPVSRWLWLVKWLLLIPHYLVLVVLWLVFMVFSIAAFFAIVFTGRYPHALFDFNVGVLRWTWRVAYYSYGALGTDRYPPFTLGEVPDYPATLHIDRPERLSRGLVWVKWWLLAIPHYLVVGVLLGGGGWAVAEADGGNSEWAGGGLISLLVFFAAVVVLFRGRYPQSIFALVLGLDRWVLRVVGYVSLMTDTYPPFRLDQGGADPGALTMEPVPSASAPPVGSPAGPAGPAPPAQPTTFPAAGAGDPGQSGGAPTWTSFAPPPSASTRWTAGRVIAVVVGVLMVLGSVGTIGTGVVAMVADQALRDDDGYLTTPDDDFTTETYALASDPVDLHEGDGPEAFYAERLLGDVRIRVAPADPDGDVFVGVGASADVEEYLSGVEHVVVTDSSGSEPTYVTHAGSAVPGPPAAQDFWVASASGTGEQKVDWDLEDGEWTVVVMNADTTPGLDVEADVGATVPGLTTLAWVLLGTGLGGLILGVGIILLAAPKGRREPAVGLPPPAT